MKNIIIFLLISCMLCFGGKRRSFYSSEVKYEYVTLVWNKNPEPDIAYYELYYGIESHKYTHTAKTLSGEETKITVMVERNNTWYFGLKAVNEAGLESEFSDECFVYSEPFIFTTVGQINKTFAQLEKE